MTQQQSDLAEKVGAVIDTIAAKLAVPAAQLWEILARQAFVDGVSYAVWTALLIVAAIAIHRYRPKWTREFMTEGQEAAMVIGIIVTGALTISAAFCLTAAVRYMASPKFYALKYILDAFK